MEKETLYTVTYTSFWGEDHHLYSDAKVFRSHTDAEAYFALQRKDIYGTIEDLGFDPRFFEDCSDDENEFRLSSSDCSAFWLLKLDETNV